MSLVVPTSTLDSILTLQLLVGWAGEARSAPPRLKWWQTDLVDAAGGGDFLLRLLPQTHAWASLELVREVARRADEHARRRMADPDTVRTLFYLGFDLDERLSERLAQLKRSGRSPAEALPFPVSLDAPFQADLLADALTALEKTPKYDIGPAGRQLSGSMPKAPDLAARQLASALLPFPEQYPTPFFRVKA